MELNKECILCNRVFVTKVSETKRGNGKFCSLSCSSKYKKKEKEHNARCSFCSKTFYRPQSKLLSPKSGLSFCGRSCKEQAQKSRDKKFISIKPSHYKDFGYDYRKTAFDAMENICNRCGYSDVPAILEVHHKDRDRKNNKIENLEILCPLCHRLEHFSSNF